jgi:hypothetical protein
MLDPDFRIQICGAFPVGEGAPGRRGDGRRAPATDPAPVRDVRAMKGDDFVPR